MKSYHFMHQIKQLPEGAIWQSVVISRKQWQLDSLAAMMGGNIRVGLEDNFYLPNGEMATSNGALVDQAVAIAKIMRREIASIEESREILGISKISSIPVT